MSRARLTKGALREKGKKARSITAPNPLHAFSAKHERPPIQSWRSFRQAI
jgi:hypothetical protein